MTTKSSHLLKGQILLAIVSAGMIATSTSACRKGALTTTSNEPPGPVPASGGPPTSSSASKLPGADKCKVPAGQFPQTPEEGCFAPRSNARSQGTGEPGPPPPASAFDTNGCLPQDMVTSSCCNPAVDGPRFRDGKCCYTFCAGFCCGRPFLVDGAPRVAETRRGDSAWSTSRNDDEHDDRHLSAALRHALHEAWLADAQLEHASAAAFGRFVIELLALGAPPSLVHGAAHAAADEVKHAEACFVLASRFAKEPVGPLPLAINGVLATPPTLEQVTRQVILEGCIGETIAALIASRQLEGAVDSNVRRTIEQIAHDEAKHAELAWAFVAWAIRTGGESIRTVVRETFEGSRAIASPKLDRQTADRSTWHSYGRLTQREISETMRSAFIDVIDPARDSLLMPVA